MMPTNVTSAMQAQSLFGYNYALLFMKSTYWYE